MDLDERNHFLNIKCIIVQNEDGWKGDDSDDNPTDVIEIPCFSSCLGDGKRCRREIEVDNLKIEKSANDLMV